jgi:hypothetical protein
LGGVLRISRSHSFRSNDIMFELLIVESLLLGERALSVR